MDCKHRLLEPKIEANQLHELETVSELKEEEEQKGSDSSKSSNSSSGSTKTINYSTAKGSKIKICDMVSQTFIYDLWTFSYLDLLNLRKKSGYLLKIIRSRSGFSLVIALT